MCFLEFVLEILIGYSVSLLGFVGLAMFGVVFDVEG